MFADLSAELSGVLPGLSPLLANNFIQRALRGIYSERNWSFQLAEAGVFCPVQIVAGTASITQFSATVTMSAAATTAWLAVATNPGYAAMQVRFSAPAALVTGQVYNVLSAVGSPLVLTLDRVVMEATSATASYQAYRSMVVAPVSDFIRWDAFVDYANAMNLRLDYTSRYFDARDPQRTSQGLAFFLGHYEPQAATGSNLSGLPRYELWPVPVQGQTFYARYKRRGPGFVLPGDVQPDVIPDSLILDRAMYKHAYPWAQANAGNFPSMKGVNWGQLALHAQKSYQETLVQVRRTDDDIRCQSILQRGHGLRTNGLDSRYPADANFLQSHLVNI